MMEPRRPPWRGPAALCRTKRNTPRLCASSGQRPFFAGLNPLLGRLAPRASIENRASARRDRDQNDPPVHPNQMKGVLRCERKALDGLKLAPGGRAGGLQPKTSHPFAAKEIESAAKHQQYAGNC